MYADSDRLDGQAGRVVSVDVDKIGHKSAFGYKFTIILIFNAKKEFDNAIFRGINCIFARDFKEIF